MYINFKQNRVCYLDHSKTVHTIYLQKNRKLYKFATTNSNFENNFFLDMHHKMYMYINFQQNRINRSISHNRAHKCI